MLRIEPAFTRLREQVNAIAGLLEEKASIPMVHEQMALIQEIQTDEWWQDVTVPMLETVAQAAARARQAHREARRKPIYTDFEDEMGEETVVELPGFASPDSFERFRAKARHFLREHEDHLAIHKLRMNKPLTPLDLAELERMLTDKRRRRRPSISTRRKQRARAGAFRALAGWPGPGSGQEGAGGISLGKDAGGESDRVREPDRRPPDRTRRDAGGAALRVALHRHHSAGAGWLVQRRAGRGIGGRAGCELRARAAA